ncbi:uncharacterized protein LOC131426620 [Malaya genurostris]|uniref:uncharacterized protein LOC131426620 n=1 Tax=Malaya genurostris TaxID=325434 RepID=UPI0026F3A1F0|nr:uncharacterized protein LOC131426620 [Malaya genurostris]
MFHRIQKLLLLGEYRWVSCGAEQMLIEGPFVQVDRCGYGIRAVELGLTEDCLFVAADDFIVNTRIEPSRKADSDPELDCLEMLCILPLRFVKLKILRCPSEKRELLRVTLVTGRCLLFEFSGGMLRPFLVNLWRDRIREFKNSRQSRRIENKVTESNDTIQLPENLRLFLECSSSSRATTDVESCVYKWERRHKTREKRRFAAKLATSLSILYNSSAETGLDEEMRTDSSDK